MAGALTASRAAIFNVPDAVGRSSPTEGLIISWAWTQTLQSDVALLQILLAFEGGGGKLIFFTQRNGFIGV